MTDAQLIKEVSALPVHLKQEVADFVAFLKDKYFTDSASPRRLDQAKGKIILKDNFDDPIPGMEAYM